MGGSKWPGRLGNKVIRFTLAGCISYDGTRFVLQQCGEIVGEFGEEEMWNAFATGEDLFKTFCEQVRLHHQSPICMIANICSLIT